MANISSLIQDEKGFIWLAGQNGLTRFDGQQAITFSSSNTSWPLPFNWLHQVSQDGQYFLLATETDGLWRFNPETGQAKKVIANIPRQSHFNAVSFQGDYYINAPDILYRYRTKTGITEVIDNNIKIKNIIHTNKHLYVSSESGLYLLNNNTLTKILHEPVTTTTALSTSVVAITKNAIFRFNDDGSQDKVDHSNNIHAVTKAFHQDNFFTVTNKGIVNKFSGSTLQAIPHKFGNIKAARVRSFLHDNSGVLWLVSNRGVEKLTENSIKDHPITFDISINANELGVYNLKGNVAEMILEKGVAKGGSWVHTNEETTIEKDFKYTKPQSWLGFRCVFVEIIQQN